MRGFGVSLQRMAAVVLLMGMSGSRTTEGATADKTPYWYGPMKEVNAGFEGNPGYVAQFGDSITYSMAFWTPVGWMEPDSFLKGDDGFPKRPDRRWRDTLKGFRAKGGNHGNYSGWRVGNVLGVIDKVLKREQPEAAIIMIGTNDMKADNKYKEGLEQLVQKCIAAHCIPILNTIPPRRGRDETCKAINAIIREVAGKHKVPLVDYYAGIVKRRPGTTWDGTLIAKDGVHPSGTDNGNFSEENLKNGGYALRTWMNFLMLREAYFRIMSAPKVFKEQVHNVETIRDGIRCDVIADTQVSAYKGKTSDERLWNWGKATRLKCKGFEEYALMKFDTSACKGMTLKRATLYLSRTENCVMNVVGLSTISSDWKEGAGTGTPGKLPPDRQDKKSRGGATYTHAIYPEKDWAGPESNFKFSVFGEGGSTWGANGSGWAKDNAGRDYYSVELPPDVAHGLLVEGDSFGLAVVDEKGQRAFQSTYRSTPNPNHFINSRESKVPCFLIVEGNRTDNTPPTPVSNATAAPGKEAGDILLSWTCTGDDGVKGDRAIGYRVYLAKGKLGPRDLMPENLLPRHKTYRPKNRGMRQQFPVYGLEPGTEYGFAVVAYDEAGNLSKPAIFSGKTREKRPFRLTPAAVATETGTPIENAGVRVWAAPSNAKISPITGNAMHERKYLDAAPAGTYRNGNAAWDGKAHSVVLFAGRNDFAGFQLAVENLLPNRMTGLRIACSDLYKSSPYSKMNRYVLMSVNDPSRFQSAMREKMQTDKEGALKIFATIKRFHELRSKQQKDPAGFFQEIEAMRARNAAEFENWIMLLGGGKVAHGQRGVIPSGGFEIFWQWSLKSEQGNWYPDPLVPVTEAIAIPNIDNRVPGQKVQAFYVDLWVPHKAEAGLYEGMLTLTANDTEPVEVPVQLTVWDFTLPNELGFVCEMNGYGYPESTSWEGALNLHRLAHRNRLNVNIVPYSHSGNWTVAQMGLETTGRGKEMRVSSFSNFDRHFGPLLSGKAFVDNPRSGVPVPAFYLPLYENWPCKLSDGFTFDQTAQHADIREDFTQEYKDGFVAVCRNIAEHLDRKGYHQTSFQFFLNNKYQYAPETTFWLLDEPMFRDDYLVVQFFGDLAREGFKNCGSVIMDYRIDCSRVQEARGMMNCVDTMVFSQSNIRNFPAVARDFMHSYKPKVAGGKREGWEYGGAGSVESQPISARGWAIDAWLGGRDGILPWLAYGKNDAWDSVEKARNAVFYPASARWDYDGCYGSLRMKSFRDGQQDVERMGLLTAKLGATRTELAQAIRGSVTLEGEITLAYAEDAGTISYRQLTPDKLAQLKRTIGENL